MEKPLKLSWLDQKFDQTIEFFKGFGKKNTKYSFFSLSETGFGESGKLGGDVRLDNTQVLTVVSYFPGSYLRGSVKDIYTGDNWLSSAEKDTIASPTGQKNLIQEGIDYKDLSINELQAGFSCLGGDSLSDSSFYSYFSKNDMSLTYEKLYTNTVFSTLVTYKFNFFSYVDYFNFDKHMIISTPSALKEDFRYLTSSYALTVLDDSTENIFRRAGRGFYDRLEKAKKIKIKAEYDINEENIFRWNCNKILASQNGTDYLEYDEKALGDIEIPYYITRCLTDPKHYGLIDSVPINLYDDGSISTINYTDNIINLKDVYLRINPNVNDHGCNLFLTRTFEGFKIKEPYNLEVSVKKIDGNLATSYYAIDENYGFEIVSENDIIQKINIIVTYNSTSGELENPQLKNYSTTVKDGYLSLPPSLPDRVYKLAEKITEDFDNDYDKIKAIEKYLSANHTYTLSPGRIPPETDFVDYFLFEAKRGYCTYYASAMVVMLRCIGIPARYAEGFVLPQVREPNATYAVTNKNAHAWPEVYLEGLGWLNFEPTSGYNSFFYDRITPSNKNDLFLENKDPASVSARETKKENTGNPDISDVNDNTGNYFTVDFAAAVLKWLIILLSGVILFFIVIAAINIIKSKIFIRNLKLWPKDISVRKIYIYFLQLNKILGKPMYAHETPSEYCTRICLRQNLHIFDRLGGMNFFEITDIFISVEYGEKMPQEDNFNKLLADFKKIHKNIPHYLGFYNYIKYKFILGQI